jgi:two-component system OmpR family sensor kinase
MRRFLADASHELRTPLASLRGYSELFRLGMAERPEDTEKAMLRIEEEATRMGILVDDLLTLARLDEVREPVREPVDLTAVLERVLEDARVAAPGRPISLRAPGAASISGDPEQIHRVFANLLANALAHTPAGTPVEVDLAVEDGRVRVTVRDHGAGLGDGDPRRLFQRFWRDSSSRDRARGGTGLGLAIVAAIAEAHGGSVQAANAPGGGAAFTVDLPGKLTSS